MNTVTVLIQGSIIVSILFATVASSQSVFPPSLGKFKSYELGEAILLFMPDKQTKFVGWDYRVNAQIFWITDGYKDSSREGLLRVHVQGKKSYVLKKEKYELAWTVRYATHSNPKFGVESIDLFPGVPNEICFGTLYDGCSFDPIHSIKAAGISAREICERSKSQQKIIGYQLSHPNRQGTLARWEEGWGSGGKESSFKLVFSVSSANLCND